MRCLISEALRDDFTKADPMHSPDCPWRGLFVDVDSPGSCTSSDNTAALPSPHGSTPMHDARC